MDERPHTLEGAESASEGMPTEDITGILTQLQRGGSDDGIAYIMDVYEAGERRYRASVQASTPTVRSAASTRL